VEWNYGPADHEHLHMQGYNEKAKIKRAAPAGDAEWDIHLVIDVINQVAKLRTRRR
jgi:hypothetical protein